MSEDTKTKKRRESGAGSVYRQGRIWWIAYRRPDGKRGQESSRSTLKGAAQRLLRKRIGAREHHLPVIANAEQYTFYQASQALIDFCKMEGRRSIKVVQRRIEKHLRPFFEHFKMAGITAEHVQQFVLHRQEQGIVNKKGKRVADVSNAEINRELATLKRIFSLAMEHERVARRPTIHLLKENNTRTGFFEQEQLNAVLRHLPDEISAVIEFGSITGWRVHSEVLSLEWRQVDFDAEEVRLEAHTTKNDEPRVFPFTTPLRTLLEAQWAAHKQLKKAGHICPNVFWRMVADERGGEKKPRPIISFTKEWKKATRAAGCPGRIPHDLRRTAVRTFVRRGIPERVAMQLSGHKTRSVFERYNIVSPGDLKDAARRLDDVAPRQRASR